MKLMINARFTLVILTIVAAVWAQALAAAQPDEAGSVPDSATSVLPAPARRPHGQHDPHGALDAQAMLEVALRHQAEGRPQEALATLDDAIARFERDGELRAVRGSMLLSYGEVARALKDLEMAAKWRPDDTSVLTNRAQAYRGFDRKDEALADLNKAIELSPDLLPARFNRGAMHHANGDYAKALEDFSHCVAVDPHAPAAYFNRASTYEALGQRQEAVADIERFKELTDNPAWDRAADELLKAWTGADAKS